MTLQNDGRPCGVLSGTLVGKGVPYKIIFLDIDGVLAPRINAGQIVHQCVEGVMALCRLAGARIVLTSAWRRMKGKTEVLENLLQQHHNGSAVFDVTPDLRGQQNSLE